MDRRAWWVTAHGVSKNRTWLNTHTQTYGTVFSISLVQFSHSVVSDFATPWSASCQAPRPSPTPEACSNSSPSSKWCHPTLSSSVFPFFSHLLSFLAPGSFPVSQFFAAGGQSIGVSASASVLPTNIQDWFPIEWVCWISFLSERLSRVFSNTTVQKCQFFGTQLSL